MLYTPINKKIIIMHQELVMGRYSENFKKFPEINLLAVLRWNGKRRMFLVSRSLGRPSLSVNLERTRKKKKNTEEKEY